MDSVDAREAYDVMVKAFLDLSAKKDFKAIGEMYAEDCRLLLPGTATGRSRQAVVEEFTKIGDTLANTTMTETDLIYGGGDIASQVGVFTCKGSKGEVLVKGKYQTVMKRIGKQWFTIIDWSNFDEHDPTGAINERFGQFVKMYINGEYDAMVEEFYTDDVKILMHGHPMLIGKAAVRQAYKSFGSNLPARIEQREGKLEKVSDDTYLQVNAGMRMIDQTGGILEENDVMLTWKVINGKFKIAFAISSPVPK